MNTNYGFLYKAKIIIIREINKQGYRPMPLRDYLRKMKRYPRQKTVGL